MKGYFFSGLIDVHKIQNQKFYLQRKEPSTGIRHSKHNGTVVRLFGPKMAGISHKISSNGLMSLVATKYLPTLKKDLKCKPF